MPTARPRREGQSAPKYARATRASTRGQGAQRADIISLPTECLIEVLKYLDIHELLGAAWTCTRFRDAARDDALWGRTHFSTADWSDVLQRHFRPTGARTHDHTGCWTRCESLLTKVSIPTPTPLASHGART